MKLRLLASTHAAEPTRALCDSIHQVVIMDSTVLQKLEKI